MDNEKTTPFLDENPDEININETSPPPDTSVEAETESSPDVFDEDNDATVTDIDDKNTEPDNAPLTTSANILDNELSDEAVLPPKKSTAVRIKEIAPKINDFFHKCGFTDKLLLRFLGVYLIISGLNFSATKDDIDPITQWRDYVTDFGIGKNLIWLLVGFLILTTIHFFVQKKYQVFDQLATFAGVIIFALSTMWRSSLSDNARFYMCIPLIVVSVIFIAYAVGKTDRELYEKLPTWLAGLIVITAAIAVTLFVAITTIAHNNSYGTSCYDFGIFVQMYHSITSNLTAVTTCERDTVLSHFNIHASYIYYLLAPIYYLFPSGNTLLAAQAVLAMGGVVPLFLIAKKHDYKGFPLVFVCLIYVFCAGILSPCYYDFHENAFLPTLLMWLLYAADQRKYVLFYVMSIITCIVKEDAPLYVICISLYLFFDEKRLKRINGIIMTVISGAYFMFINNWLAKNGDGEMMASSRFGNLTINSEDGFVGIIKNVLVDPAYFFSQFLTRRNDADTPEQMLIFLLQIVLPLLFLPFITKKIHRFLLIIPFVIMNLVVGSGYGYASSIGYQYIFGPSCLLIYMLLINCDDFEPDKRNTFVTCSAVASLIMTVSLLSGNIRYYENYSERKESFQEIQECLDSIPDDVSVASNTWYLPHIANRDELFILDNNDFQIDAESDSFVAFNELERYDFLVMNYNDTYIQDAVEYLIDNGFVLYNEASNAAGHVVIYARAEYAQN